MGLRMMIVCLVLIIKNRKSAKFGFINKNQIRIIFSYYFLFQFRDLMWLYIKINLNINKKGVITVLLRIIIS